MSNGANTVIHEYSQLGSQGDRELFIHTWRHLDDGLKLLDFGLVHGPLSLRNGPCTGLNDVSLQHFKLIQPLLIELPNLAGGGSNAQKCEITYSFTQPHPGIRASWEAQNSHRTREAVGPNLTDVKTESDRGKWLKGFIGKSRTEASRKTCLLTSQ